MLASVLVLAAVLVAFGAILYVDLSNAMYDTIANDLGTSAHTILAREIHDGSARAPRPVGDARHAAPPLPPADAPFAAGGQEIIPLASEQETSQLFGRLTVELTNFDIAARVIGVDGQTVVDGPPAARFFTPPSPVLDQALYRAVASSGKSRHLTVRTPTGSVLVALIPLGEANGAQIQTVGVLQITTSLQLANDLLSRLRALLVAGTLLAIGATIALTALLVRAVLEPLRKMTATSRAIADGALERRVIVPAGEDELTDLARAFNHMVTRLESLVVAQRRFIADASHELRTPLTALAGGLEMLQIPDADRAARARLTRLLQGETARMSRLVDGLLTLTRLDAQGKKALAIRPVDLSSLAAEVVDETRLLAPDLDVVLDLDERTPVVVPGDVDRLHQLLLNLSTNARAHTHPPGAITVTVRQEGEAARLSVADTGSGIAPEELAHIWDRFYRSDRARQRQAGQGGMGLGLSIVRAIVESHDGTTDIASTLGVGTTVTVTLPGAMSPTPQPAEERASAHPATVGRRQPRSAAPP